MVAILRPPLEENINGTYDYNAEIGVSCTVLSEPWNNPTFNKADCETVFRGQNNSYIVLGRDRPGDLGSGYGGRGHSKDSMIDIVVGRLSAIDARTITNKINPNPFSDASRVYISQKTDADSNFNLPPGKSGTSRARAAIVLKSDDIRIISRNSMKLVTTTDAILSNNERPDANYGVQLISSAGEQELQPIPKGKFLVDELTDLVNQINKLSGIVKAFMEVQRDFNREIAKHTHPTPFYGQPTFLSPQLILSGKTNELGLNFKVDQAITAHNFRMINHKLKYLLSTGGSYINSTFHFLN